MIVKTLLDTDLYKFTTSYAYIKLFPYAMGTFSFNDRNETKYTEAFLETLKAEIKNLSQLRFTEEELEYEELQISPESLLGVVVFFSFRSE